MYFLSSFINLWLFVVKIAIVVNYSLILFLFVQYFQYEISYCTLSLFTPFFVLPSLSYFWLKSYSFPFFTLFLLNSCCSPNFIFSKSFFFPLVISYFFFCLIIFLFSSHLCWTLLTYHWYCSGCYFSSILFIFSQFLLLFQT